MSADISDELFFSSSALKREPAVCTGRILKSAGFSGVTWRLGLLLLLLYESLEGYDKRQKQLIL